MLTLNLDTTLKLLDSDSLNAATGVIATVFDDPNKISITDYTEWFSARIESLMPFQTKTFIPHFTAKFLILETSQAVDLEILQPPYDIPVIAGNTAGRVIDTATDILFHNVPDFFANIEVDDLVTLSGGTGITQGQYTVINKLSNEEIQLNTDFFIGVGTATNVAFSVSRHVVPVIFTMHKTERFFCTFCPIETLSVTNVSLQQTNVRIFALG
jgi:hypothetical protein